MLAAETSALIRRRAQSAAADASTGKLQIKKAPSAAAILVDVDPANGRARQALDSLLLAELQE
jgi:hypothetical protein